MSTHTLFPFEQDSEMCIAELIKRLKMLKKQGLWLQAHPLGFVKVPLQYGQKRTEDGTYIHIWLPGLPCQQGGPYIHTHVFHMRSRILCLDGTFVNTTYSTEKDEQGAYQLMSAIPHELVSEIGTPIERVNLRVLKEEQEQKGSTYSLPPHIFHQTTVQGRAITFVEKKQFEEKFPVLAIPSSQTLPLELFDHKKLEQEAIWSFMFETLKNS